MPHATVQISARIISNKDDPGFEAPFVLTADVTEVEVSYGPDEHNHFPILRRALAQAGDPADWGHGVGWRGRWTDDDA